MPGNFSSYKFMASEQAALLLRKQLKGTQQLKYINQCFFKFSFLTVHVIDLSKSPVDGFSAGLVDENNIYEWDIMIIGPPDTL